MKAPAPDNRPSESRVRDISEAVYRDRLGREDAAALVAKHGDAVLRTRAAAYDTLTRAYLRAIGRGA